MRAQICRNLRLVSLTWLVLAATSASAREFIAPVVWFTPGGGIAWPPAELGYGENGVSDTQPMFGGVVGVKLVSDLSLELRGHYGKAADLADLQLLHGSSNLSWFLAPRARIVPFLSAGGSVVDLKSDATDDSRLLGFNAGGGFLLRFTDQVGLRLDARYLSYELHDSADELGYRAHTELFAGLNVGFGGAAKDNDQDGIPDRVDRCAQTPLGARVDAVGCPIDGDQDGVPDGLDRCEHTPQGATVDASGCPSDADGDGILDGLDQCAATPKGAKVDGRGCPLDADGDKVFDGLDQCDNTPQGCSVNAQGCPSDADADGICDGVDRCSDTPADVRVDAKGCPIVLTEKETELLDTGMIRLQNVNFDSGKSTIQPQSHVLLDEVGEILARWPELRIEIGGHTDSRGSEEFNQTLSEERARAVLDYLLGRFAMLKPQQLSSAGYGEGSPIAPNDSELNLAKNRRVEFKVLNTEALRRETEKTKLAPKQGN